MSVPVNDPYAPPKAESSGAVTDLPFTIPGFERQTVALRPGGLFGRSRVIVNGVALKADGHPFALTKDDGTQTQARLKTSLDPIPRLEVAGQLYRAVRPLRWYEWALCLIPIGLIFQGGALGGLTGFVGFSINARMLRSERPLVLRVLLSLAVDLATGAVFLALAAAVARLFQR